MTEDQVAASSPYVFSVLLWRATHPSWWYTALTAEQVAARLQANQARLTSVSAYVDADNTLKFAVVMVADGQPSWSYLGLTSAEVDQCLVSNNAHLTKISAYVDVDSTLKFAVIMAVGVRGSWYPGLSASEVAAQLAANQACLSAISAYVDVDETLKYAVAMAPGDQRACPYHLGLSLDPASPSGSVDAVLKANPSLVLVDFSPYTDIDNVLRCAIVLAPGDPTQSWWYDGLDTDEISSRISKSGASEISRSGAQMAALAAHLPMTAGSIRAAFMSPDLYLATTWSADGVNWPTSFPGPGNSSSRYVGIGPPGSQPNAFGAPSFAYFGGAYRVGYLNDEGSKAWPWITSSADGVSEWNPTPIAPDGGWTNQDPNGGSSSTDPASSSPILAVFKGKLWTAFLQTHQQHPKGTADRWWKDDGSGWIVVCSTSDCKSFSPIATPFPNTAISRYSSCPPSLAVFDDKLWLAFQSAALRAHVLISSSTDGITWSDPVDVTGTPVTQSAPSLASFNGRLWLAFGRTYDGPGELMICSSPDGTTWSPPVQVQGQMTPTGPSLTTFTHKLWLGFVKNYDANFPLLVCWSPNGERWSAPIPMNQSTTGDDWSDRNLASPYKGVAICGTTTGQVSPLYKLLTITYAPPGGTESTPSSVKYGFTNITSTATSIGNTFAQSTSVDVSVGDSTNNLSAGFNSSATDSDSSSFTTTINWADIPTLNGGGTDDVDHSLDSFYLWLNPVFDVSADVTGNLDLYLGGSGEDDTIWLYAYELQDPSRMAPDNARRLAARGLTSLDYGTILSCNPFLAPDYDPGKPPDPGRFVRTPTPSPRYEGRPGPKRDSTDIPCSMTTSSGKGDKISTFYGVSYSASAGLKDVFKVTTKNTFTWTDTTEETDTKTKTLTATATIYEPSYGYTGPTNLVVYMDKIYQTFMFAFEG